MTITKEELEQLKQEYEDFKQKLDDLTDDEIEEIVGGFDFPSEPEQLYKEHFYKNEVDKEGFSKKF